MSELQPHQQRIVTEKEELDERLKKLRTFISDKGPVYMRLPEDEKNRLIRQEKAMSDYSTVLGERIGAF